MAFNKNIVTCLSGSNQTRVIQKEQKKDIMGKITSDFQLETVNNKR
jgi:hypothetical protein